MWGLAAAGVVARDVPRAVVTYLLFINVAIGVFNLIPGFPLDGGRLLRAVIWRWKGTFAQATIVASRVGVGVAVALMALGVFPIFGGSVLGGFWMILIGLFLRSAAGVSYAQIALREALGRLSVRGVMTRDVVTVDAAASATGSGRTTSRASR